MNAAFWQGRKVLLTGHSGFKGSWLSLWLQQMGAEVTGYSLLPISPSMFEIARVGSGMCSIWGDVRDLAQLRDTISAHQPEIIIHMAAQALVRRSYREPVETYATNVMGTVHLLEAARTQPCVRVVLNVTSDKCYENFEWERGYREDDAMGGFDPYSSSKGCAELVTAAYRNSYFKDGAALASARAGNVIGGGDWAEDRLIPDIMRAITSGRAARIRNPAAIRPWQHVLEPLSGYLLLAQMLYEKGAPMAEGWNFGPSDHDARPVQWIADRLTTAWGEGACWKQDVGEHPHEAHSLKLDCGKARERLGWHPRWTLDQALDAIVAWHKGYRDGEDMRELSLRQISSYMNSTY